MNQAAPNLNSLPMLTKDINADDSLVKLRISALGNIVIQMFFISKSVHAFEYKLEQRLQILRTGTRYEDIRIPVRQRSCDR